MNNTKVDVRLLEHLLDVHNKNGTRTITLPKSFCDSFKIKPGNQIKIVVEEIHRGRTVEDLVQLYVKD